LSAEQEHDPALLERVVKTSAILSSEQVIIIETLIGSAPVFVRDPSGYGYIVYSNESATARLSAHPALPIDWISEMESAHKVTETILIRQSNNSDLALCHTFKISPDLFTSPSSRRHLTTESSDGLGDVPFSSGRNRLFEEVPITLHVSLALRHNRHKAMAAAELAAKHSTELFLGRGISGSSISVGSARKLIVEVHQGHLTTAAELLSKQPFVHFIERAPIIHVLNKFAASIVQSRKPLTESISCPADLCNPLRSALGLDGTGEVVAVADSGVDINSCFFKDDDAVAHAALPFDSNISHTTHRKFVNYHRWADGVDELGGHGTHVCSSAVGECTPSLSSTTDNVFDDDYYTSEPVVLSPAEYSGVAPKAKLAFFDLGSLASPLATPADLGTGLFPQATLSGAAIHSDSWGSSSNDYTGSAWEIDQYVWEHPEMLIIVAGGNDGMYGGHTVGSPATSKNGIAVGASSSISSSSPSSGQVPTTLDDVASYSSRGPTGDGRLKPDLLAPGTEIISASALSDGTTASCSLRPMTGTSMATPIVAGAAALVRQYLREGFYPGGVRNLDGNRNFAGAFNSARTASAALVKAMLIQSAQLLTSSAAATSPAAAPDFTQVWMQLSMQPF
jgi:subtilisin family serine protease